MAEDRKEIPLQLPHFPTIKTHRQCVKELNELIQVWETASFIADYEARLRFLRDHMGQETVHKWFEKLGDNAKQLRSIHMMKYRNLRILYVIEKGIAYLLLAFEEKQGHQNTEYRKYIPAALNRLNEKGRFI